MAYTDITNNLLNNMYAEVSGVATISKINNPISSYSFAASAYNGTNYFASQNLGVHSSAASMRFDIYPQAANGINLKISYIIDSEKSYDIGYFSKSGVTLTTGTSLTTGSTSVYAHTYNQNGYTVREVNYYIPSQTTIDIVYQKDSSQNTGWDRLLFGISVEAATGGGGGTDPGTTYYWMLGTRILPVGTKKSGDGTYTLPSTALTSFTAHLEAYSNGFPGANMTVLTSGNYRILWASGSSTSNIWATPNGSNPYTSALPYILGGVFGHYDQDLQTYSTKVYTGTTAQLYSPTSVFGSINNTATFYQCRYNVVVESDKNSLKKAYFDVNFGSPFNQTWKTGKNGNVLLISSATNSSVSITVSRTGSGDKSGSLTRPGAGSSLVLSPTSNSDKIMTANDLWGFDTTLGHNYAASDGLCIKYDSSIHDTGYSGTYKLMHIHEFLYFTGTPEYFKDDTMAQYVDGTWSMPAATATVIISSFNGNSGDWFGQATATSTKQTISGFPSNKAIQVTVPAPTITLTSIGSFNSYCDANMAISAVFTVGSTDYSCYLGDAYLSGGGAQSSNLHSGTVSLPAGTSFKMCYSIDCEINSQSPSSPSTGPYVGVNLGAVTISFTYTS